MLEQSIRVFILFTCFIAGSCKHSGSNTASLPASANKPKPTMVDVLIAHKQPLAENWVVNGTVEAVNKTEIKPEVSGKIVYLHLPDGEAVSKGEVLAKLNDEDLQANLKKVKAQLELAEKTEVRLKKLIQQQAINQADYDVAYNQVKTLQADVQLLQAQIEKTVIKAPYDGVLGLRAVSLGAIVSPTTLLSTLTQTASLQIDFSLPQSALPLVKKGMLVQAVSSNKDTLPAKVEAFEGFVNKDNGNIIVRASLLNKIGSIKPGSFVTVIVPTHAAQLISVPTNAIIPEASGNQLVLVKAGKGKLVNVQTGTRNADKIAILSGINEGDTVVVGGVLFVKNGAEVKVKNIVK